MDIKQLVTGNPKAGFYPVTQDTITVIELNKAVMNLTNESSSEEIIAAFDNLESFQALIAEVRNPQNICSGILINETPEDKRVGKYEASIIANTNAETLHVRWIEIDKIVVLTITNTDGTMSCIRNENNVGGGSGESNIYIFEPNGNNITLEEYTALENAINSNKIILYKTGELRFLIINAAIIGNNIVLIITDGNNSFIGMKITKDSLKIEHETYTFVAREDVLTKSNTEPFTPDADYEPATKKYVDDKNIEIPLIDITDYYQNKELTIPQTFLNEIINRIDNKEIIPGKFCAIQFQRNADDYMYAYSVTYHFSKELVYINAFNRNTPEYGTGHTSGNGFVEIILTANSPIKLKYSGDVSERILTESEYSALGEAVNTDGILYFVTPDA